MNADQPLVSVVMPCFNAARYVRAAIDSIMLQSEMALEIVFVDDGSTDDSAAIAQSYAPVLRYIRQDNAGISAARNAGIEAARGDMLAFLDADDVWTPGSLATRWQALQSAPSPACVFGALEAFYSEELSSEQRGSFSSRGESPSAARFPGTMLMARTDFLKVGLFDRNLPVGEMIAWLAMAERAGVHFVTIDDLVLRRRLHGENTSLRRSGPSSSAYLRALKAGLDVRRATRAAPDDRVAETSGSRS